MAQLGEIMDIKPLILATLQDSGPANISELRDALFVGGGVMCRSCACITVMTMVTAGTVNVADGVYRAAN